jgi:hypothetical protein
VKRPQASSPGKSSLPESVTYTWTDAKGSRFVERWLRKDDASDLKLVERTASGQELSVAGDADAERSHMPSPVEILRALPAAKSPGGVPFLASVERGNVQIAVEKLVDRLEEARSYPQVGVARHHRRHFKCTVTFDSIMSSDWPVPYTRKDARSEVVNIDHDSLDNIRPGE